MIFQKGRKAMNYSGTVWPKRVALSDRNTQTVFWQQKLSFRFHFPVPTNWGMAGMQACHQAGTRRCTYCRSRLHMRAPHAVQSQSVDIWRFKLLLSKTREIAITKIVGYDKYYIGLGLGSCRKTSESLIPAIKNLCIIPNSYKNLDSE